MLEADPLNVPGSAAANPARHRSPHLTGSAQGGVERHAWLESEFFGRDGQLQPRHSAEQSAERLVEFQPG